MTSKNSLEEEQVAFLGTQQREKVHPHSSDDRTQWRPLQFLRLFVELAMACAIIVLAVRATKSQSPQQPIRKSPVPQFPRKMYTFKSNTHYMPEDMFFNQTDTLRALHNWIELSSDSRGYVQVQDASHYDLPEPYTIALDRHHDGPGYMMTVFHQLHCLSYLAVHFQQGYDGVKLEEEVAHHSVHCFNNLRQGLMCNADTTLEGKTKEGPGEGSEHECVDYDALLEWANEHSGMKWREGLMPEDSTL